MASGLKMLLPLATIVLLVCGVQGRVVSGSVKGGENARVEEFPWQVALEYFGKHVCGGSVLSEHWVLSVARCLNTYYLLKLRSSTSTREAGGLIHDIKRTIIHDKFIESLDKDYDVGVVEMEKPFVWSNQLKPIRGLATENPPNGTRVIVTGWGRLSYGKKPKQLQKATMHIVDSNECMETSSPTEILERRICSLEEVSGVCAGDYGDPVIDEKTSVQVAIASYVMGRCGMFASLLTSIPDMRDWIKEKTGVSGDVVN